MGASNHGRLAACALLLLAGCGGSGKSFTPKSEEATPVATPSTPPPAPAGVSLNVTRCLTARRSAAFA